ncbi:MAG: ABC transporter permease [candidate division WOR-3 bacterium]
MRAVIFKEIKHILRDPLSLTVILAMPVAYLFLFLYSITFDIKGVPMGVVDYENSSGSRDFLANLTAHGYFDLRGYYPDENALLKDVSAGRVKLGLVIPDDFEENMARGRLTYAGWFEGVEGNSTNIARGYLFSASTGFLLNRAERMGVSSPVGIRPRYLYNPMLRSGWFLAPGFSAIILMLIATALTALSLVREREEGKIDILRTMPVNPYGFVVAKAIPYILIGLVDFFITVGLVTTLYGVPIKGGILSLTGFTLLFLFPALGLGLVISSLATAQREAWFLALATTLLPSIILSGFVFPVESMPFWLRAIAEAMPVRHYLVILRSVMIKGTGIRELWPHALVLLLYGFAMVAMAGRRMREWLSAG